MSEDYGWKCPECKTVSPRDTWVYVPEAVFCDDDICNDWHSGEGCPACGAVFDYGGTFGRIKRVPPYRHVGPIHVMGPDGLMEVRTKWDTD
jgi:hypothetical protein